MPKIRQFNGGLHTATFAGYIQQNEAVEYINCDHVSGFIGPVSGINAEVGGASPYGYYYRPERQWYWSDTPKDYVEYRNRLYIGNRTGKSTKVVNGVEYNLGIEKPTDMRIDLQNDDSLKIITYLDLELNLNVSDIPANTPLNYRVVNYDFSVNPPVITLSEVFSITTSTTPNLTVRAGIALASLEIATYARIFREYEGTYYLLGTALSAGVAFFDDTYDISTTTTITLDPILSDPNVITSANLSPVTYAYTFYNATEGVESAPLIDNLSFNMGESSIVRIYDLDISPDPQVTSKKIYRIGRNLTSYTLVATIDNATTEYVDSLADNQLPGELLTSQDNLPPPTTGISHLTEAYAMLFATSGSRLIYTNIGTPDYWPATNFIDFPKFLTGIAVTPIGLLVFDRFSTWLITGTGPLAFAKQQLTGSQGCTNGDTIVNVQGAAWWASTDGICVSDGGSVVVYTRPKLGKQGFLDAINAVVYDDEYYLARENNTILVLDTSRNIIRELDWEGTSTLITADDDIYAYKNSALYKYSRANPPIPFKYKSPLFYGTGLTEQKTYKNFYFAVVGEVLVGIIIDGILVSTQVLSGEDIFQVKIPSEDTRGKGVQFTVEGTGIVTEIAWEEGDANA